MLPKSILLAARITVICQYWWLFFKLWNLSFTSLVISCITCTWKAYFLLSLTLSAIYFFCLKLNFLVWACNYKWSITLERKRRPILGNHWACGVFQVDFSYQLPVKRERFGFLEEVVWGFCLFFGFFALEIIISKH